MKDIETLTKELGEAIQASDVFTAYTEAREAYENDPEIEKLVGEFNLKKMAVLNEMKNEDKDEAKLKTMQDEMRAAYTELMVNPLTSRYTDAKEALELCVNKIYQTINFYVTGEEAHECSGSCDTCGGCH